jgi:hypothetical protein
MISQAPTSFGVELSIFAKAQLGDYQQRTKKLKLLDAAKGRMHTVAPVPCTKDIWCRSIKSILDVLAMRQVETLEQTDARDVSAQGG